MNYRNILSILALTVWAPGEAFEWHAPGQRPEVTRQAIAGLWKLTPSLRPKYPIKEFTVYPKKNEKRDDDEPELLLMLKEDGSFQEYSADDQFLVDDDESIEDSWKRFTEKQKHDNRKAELAALARGTWDYRDGKLILAADRPATAQQPSKESTKDMKQHQDTLLEGRVVATYETSLPDNPVLESNVGNTTVTANQRQSTTTEKRWDTHLAVPKGRVKVGKFFYPKHHPAFFDQPIFKPSKIGAFQLRQILGSLNTNLPNEQTFVEKFQRSDFYNKTFLLTSHPLVQRAPAGNTRWSTRQNKFIEEPLHNEAAKKYAEDIQNRPVQIRVMQVRFFQNNTFATIWGAGDAILRGKFDVIGQDSDHLWMTISRFGFGRSVSGSVFSEGRMLSQDDAKSYWGRIRYESVEEDNEQKNTVPNGKKDQSIPSAGNPSAGKVQVSTQHDQERKKLEVQGSVLFGSGLEPLPVGRFIMRETDDSFDSFFDEEDEDDDEEDGANLDNNSFPDMSAPLPDMGEEDGVDLSSDDVFQ